MKSEVKALRLEYIKALKDYANDLEEGMFKNDSINNIVSHIDMISGAFLERLNDLEGWFDPSSFVTE